MNAKYISLEILNKKYRKKELSELKKKSKKYIQNKFPLIILKLIFKKENLIYTFLCYSLVLTIPFIQENINKQRPHGIARAIVNNLFFMFILFLINLVKLILENIIKETVKVNIRKKIFLNLLLHEKGRILTKQIRVTNAFGIFFAYLGNFITNFFQICFDIIPIIINFIFLFTQIINLNNSISYQGAIFISCIGFLCSLTYYFFYSIYIKIEQKYINKVKKSYNYVLQSFDNMETIFFYKTEKKTFKEYENIENIIQANISDKIISSSMVKSLSLLFAFIQPVLTLSLMWLGDISNLNTEVSDTAEKFIRIIVNITSLFMNFFNLQTNNVKLSDAFIDILQPNILLNKKIMKQLLLDENIYNKLIKFHKENYFKLNRAKFINQNKNYNIIEINNLLLEKENLNNKEKQKILFIEKLNIKRNDVVLIKGKTGCGKTSLLNIISGYSCFQQGECNINIKQRDYIDMLHSNIKLFNFQNLKYNLLYLIKPNILAANKNEILKTTSFLFDQLSLNFINKKTFKYNQIQFCYFSSGQKQRIKLFQILLSTIINKKKILMLDEPLTYLDQKTAEKISKNIINIKKKHNFTLLIVTHNNYFDQYQNTTLNL